MTHISGLTTEQKNSLSQKYSDLLHQRDSWRRAGTSLDFWPHLHIIEEAAKHAVVSKKLIALATDLVVHMSVTPDSEVVLPHEVRKRLEDLEKQVFEYFDLSERHELEIRDTRPSTLPHDPELGGK